MAGMGKGTGKGEREDRAAPTLMQWLSILMIAMKQKQPKTTQPPHSTDVGRHKLF